MAGPVKLGLEEAPWPEEEGRRGGREAQGYSSLEEAGLRVQGSRGGDAGKKEEKHGGAGRPVDREELAREERCGEVGEGSCGDKEKN